MRRIIRSDSKSDRVAQARQLIRSTNLCRVTNLERSDHIRSDHGTGCPSSGSGPRDRSASAWREEIRVTRREVACERLIPQRCRNEYRVERRPCSGWTLIRQQR
jgi:hypothetical protein